MGLIHELHQPSCTSVFYLVWLLTPFFSFIFFFLSFSPYCFYLLLVFLSSFFLFSILYPWLSPPHLPHNRICTPCIFNKEYGYLASLPLGRVFTLDIEIGKCASALKEEHPPNQVHPELQREAKQSRQTNREVYRSLCLWHQIITCEYLQSWKRQPSKNVEGKNQTGVIRRWFL